MSITVIKWKPVNDREKSINLYLDELVKNAYSTESVIKRIKQTIESDDDINYVFGNKPSYFYDFEKGWYWFRLYHKNRKGQRKRIVLTACLSGMEHLVPQPQLDIKKGGES